jgi:hypothetical protein
MHWRTCRFACPSFIHARAQTDDDQQMKVAGIALSDRRGSTIHLLQLVAADLAHVLGRMGRVLAFEMDVGVRGAVVTGAGGGVMSTPRGSA